MNIKRMITALILATLITVPGLAEKSVLVGGFAMSRSKDIIDNAVNSKDHTTFVAAVLAAGLIGALKGAGPFTVFAPTNAAFEKLPNGIIKELLKPEAKPVLAKVLNYHVVAGKMDSKMIAAAIKKGNGKALLKTVAGGSIAVSMSGKDLLLTDEKGEYSKVTIADVYQRNGVIHVINSVLMPK